MAVKMRKNESKILEIGEQSLVSSSEFLRKDAGFTHHRNKVRIADPAGKHMHVQMMFHAGAGGAADIKSHIESVGMIFLPNRVFTGAAQLYDFMKLLDVCVAERRDMTVGYYKQVAGGIGEEV